MALERRTFGRRDRLSGERAFSVVYAQKCSAADANLLVYVRRNSVGHPRLGLSVGRKHGGAVVRNRIKRLLREAFRLMRDQLPAGFDLVCVPRVREAATLADYQSSLPSLARQAVGRWNRKEFQA